MRPSYRTTLSVHPCVPTFDTSISHIHPSTHHLSLFLPPSHLFICICHLSVYPPTHPSLSIHPSIFSIIYPSSSLSFIHHLLYRLSTYHLSTYLPTCPLSIPTYLSHLSLIYLYVSLICVSLISVPPSVCTYLPVSHLFTFVYLDHLGIYLSTKKERLFLRNWLMQQWELAGPKSSG